MAALSRMEREDCMRTQLFRILSILCFGLAAYGQTFGGISGEIRDAQGSVVPAAEVTITNTATNAGRKAVSNDAGLYSFPSLPPGVYDIKVTKTGFKTANRNTVEIQVQQNARIDFDLLVGQVSEAVEVS